MRRVIDTTKARRGDTIIEVIFAVIVFSFVAISVVVLMNRGISTSEAALEVTLVRQQINAQAEALRYLHQARVVSPSSPEATVWNSLTPRYQTGASTFGAASGTCALPSGSAYMPFILNAQKATVWGTRPSDQASSVTNSSRPPFSQVVYDSSGDIVAAYGIWIEAVSSSAPVQVQFVDFHIRACWPSPSGQVPMTIGTIVRLYDPNRI